MARLPGIDRIRCARHLPLGLFLLSLATANTVSDNTLTLSDQAHRPLRDNPPAAEPASAEPEVFNGYPDAPHFTVAPSRNQSVFFPCMNCHSAKPPDPQRRHLNSPHPATQDHGEGRIWCLDCHDMEDRNKLRTLAGDKLDFDQTYLQCGECHYQPQKDWYYGGHGKRVGNWQGERQLYNCTHCHDPHNPAVRPREPQPPPPVRLGLKPMPTHPALMGEYTEESHEQE